MQYFHFNLCWDWFCLTKKTFGECCSLTITCSLISNTALLSLLWHRVRLSLIIKKSRILSPRSSRYIKAGLHHPRLVVPIWVAEKSRYIYPFSGCSEKYHEHTIYYGRIFIFRGKDPTGDKYVR